MVRNFDGAGALIEQWLKNKDTVLFLGVWERINNPGFNSLEFEGIRNEAGRNSFFLSAKKWIDLTGANDLIASAGRYGGTYAHKDIAFDSGEMDRWDTVRLHAPEMKRLVEAFDAVTDLLNSTPPGEPVPQLTRANGLLRQVMDLLRQAGKKSSRGLADCNQQLRDIIL
jgi:hypothetical protein